MSRGPGRIMQAVEARLTSTPQATYQLAADIYGNDPATPSQVECVRRAAHSLKRLDRAVVGQGRVMTDELERTIERMDGTTYTVYRKRTALTIRMPFTPEEVARAEAMRERMRALRR